MEQSHRVVEGLLEDLLLALGAGQLGGETPQRVRAGWPDDPERRPADSLATRSVSTGSLATRPLARPNVGAIVEQPLEVGTPQPELVPWSLAKRWQLAAGAPPPHRLAVHAGQAGSL
jgi:hypothetical protein